MVHSALLALLLSLLMPPAPQIEPGTRYVFPYFLDNGQAGIYIAVSPDGLAFTGLNDNRPVVPAPDWPGANLTRDPSIVFHEGVFHMVWTTGWTSRTIGYARSSNLIDWSEPRQIPIWGDRAGVRNTWAPELHWDPDREEFFIIWASTLDDYPGQKDGDGHGYDHRLYVARTTDFEAFSEPELFYTPKDPEHGVIDGAIAHDPENGQWVMVIKNEMPPHLGGKNLRLTFADHAQGPYHTALSEPIVGAGTKIVDRMGEGPSLVRVDGKWRLYWDAPGQGYCLATSPDLIHWTDHSGELVLPQPHARHGTVLHLEAAADQSR